MLSLPRAWVQSLVRKLRSHKLRGMAKKKKNQKTQPYDTSIKEKPVIIAINKHVKNNCYKNNAIKFCLGVMAS